MMPVLLSIVARARWELPAGYGRVKPDVGAYSKNLLGSHPNGGCRTLSGTSVASPVVAGACVLLVDSLRQRLAAARKADACDTVAHAQSGGCGAASHLAALLVRNPMIVKQAVLATAVRLPLDHASATATPTSTLSAAAKSRQTVPSSWLVAPNIFEQGAGKLDLLAAYRFLQRARPHLSAHPSALDLTDCPHFFPVCAQPIFWSARPLLINVTLLSSLAASSELDGAPALVDCNAAAGLLDVSFRWSEGMHAVLDSKVEVNCVITI
jgi:membrane-bound transcription factor site-1 protease